MPSSASAISTSIRVKPFLSRLSECGSISDKSEVPFAAVPADRKGHPCYPRKLGLADFLLPRNIGSGGRKIPLAGRQGFEPRVIDLGSAQEHGFGLALVPGNYPKMVIERDYDGHDNSGHYRQSNQHLQKREPFHRVTSWYPDRSLTFPP